MKASLHPKTTLSLVRSRIRPWPNSTGPPHPKCLLRSRGAGFKRWARVFSYRLATNKYVFYGSLILAASLIAGAVTRGHETLWRSAASLGLATVVIGFAHAWLDSHSGGEGSASQCKRRAKKH